MNLILRDKALSPVESEFNRLLRDFFSPSSLLSNEACCKPAIELSDDKENIYLKAELPGVSKENVDIQVAEEYITLSGEYNNQSECRDEEGRVYQSELRQGNFIRNIPLPESVEFQKANAEFKDGILSISIPKSKVSKDKVKQIKL